MLWIAFKIVFLLMIPNLKTWSCIYRCVVNCFQNCIFTYDSQQCTTRGVFPWGCELLSKLYFYLWFPTSFLETSTYSPLWIAFKIVFLLMIPNPLDIIQSPFAVVNCFQNCIFTYDSQLTWLSAISIACCELLSKLYFYLWFPTWYQIGNM